MLRILHTSDLHLGKNFTAYGKAIAKHLHEARFETLDKMVTMANENKVDLFVIAGDLFHTLKTTRADIARTSKILNKFSGLVLILAGNHDFYSGNEDLWKNLEDQLQDTSLIFKEYRPYDLRDYGYPVVIYPAFCQSKHSKENNLAWIKNEQIDQGLINICLAHGALEGLSADIEGNYFSMTKDELNSLAMDLCLLGHTHVPYPLLDDMGGSRIFNAGTHEPDGMNYAYKGSAYIIDIDKDYLEAKRVITGKYSFEDREDKIDDLKAYTSKISKDRENTLLRISPRGYISQEDYDKRSDYYSFIRDRVFYLDVRDQGLKVRITADLIKEKYLHGSFPEVMLNKLKDDEDRLQLAYNLIEESRKK